MIYSVLQIEADLFEPNSTPVYSSYERTSHRVFPTTFSQTRVVAIGLLFQGWISGQPRINYSGDGLDFVLRRLLISAQVFTLGQSFAPIPFLKGLDNIGPIFFWK